MELKIAYAMRGNEYVPIRDYQGPFAESQVKVRPTDLVCPECDQAIIVRYPRDPNVQTVVVHYAHSPKLSPEYRCALSNAESASHFNTKIFLARQMQRAVQSARGFALVFRCRAEGCRKQEIFFEIKDYDNVQPERKVGRVRPDVSCFRGEQAVGAAEVLCTHAVGLEKQYDLNTMGVDWFEVPSKNLKDWARSILPFNSRDGGYTLHALDADRAQITYPRIPEYCDICQERYRRQGVMAQAYQDQMAQYKARVASHVEAVRAKTDEQRRVEAEFYAQPVRVEGGEWVFALGCLYCGHQAELQDRRGAGLWYCARCRVWVTSEKGVPKISL